MSDVTPEAFAAQYDRLRVRPENAAPRGAFDRLTANSVVTAARLVRSGRVIQTALPWNTESGIDNPRPALHHMVDLGDKESPEPSTYKDYLAVDYHGKSVSHLDALSHIAFHGRLYGDVAAAEVVTTRGAEYGSVATLGPFVGRGVLLDVPAARGVEYIDPSTRITPADLVDVQEKLGVSLQPNDAVLLRTGHKRRRDTLGAWDSGASSAGLHVDSMDVVAESQIVFLGSDGDSDARPSPVAGVHSPIHILALTALGIPLLDNLDLEALSAACADEGRYEFLFVVSPLVVPTGTGSPVNPLAIF